VLDGPVIASLDSAFTKNEQNDPSALTVWGIFRTREEDRVSVMLLHAWRKHLQMHGDPPPRLPNERDEQYRVRTSDQWGLVQWVAHTCRRFRVDHLLIEGKASGLTAADELRRLHGREGWMVRVCPVRGDKVSRALAVQPLFAQGLIWAPNRDWANLMIDEAAMFPLGRRDDLTDSCSMALSHMRNVGLLHTDEEVAAAKAEAAYPRPRQRATAIYPC
jgi:predicted phage terminase large subunit-like protein